MEKSSTGYPVKAGYLEIFGTITSFGCTSNSVSDFFPLSCLEPRSDIRLIPRQMNRLQTYISPGHDIGDVLQLRENGSGRDADVVVRHQTEEYAEEK